MLNTEELSRIMVELAEGRLEPEQWMDWWRLHEADVESTLPRGEFLRIKPKTWGGEAAVWRAIYQSQEGAFGYLQDRQIHFRASFRYRDNWDTEFDAFYKAEERKRKERANALKSQFPELFRQYPKFGGSLQHTYDTDDVIGPGATDKELAHWESENSIRLPEDIRTFFQTCNPLRLEGIRLELDAIRPITISKKGWWVLGEFWKDGDGDILLFQPEASEVGATPIYYYEHELNKVKKLCVGMRDLLEKKMAWYNRQ